MADEKNNQEAIEDTADEVAMAPETEIDPHVLAEDSAAEITRLKLELEAKEKLLAEAGDRIKRLQADFDNFRRRTRQEKEELSAVVAQELIKELLPLLDNFERALAAKAGEDASIRNGVEMIYKQCVAVLEKNGLEKIAATGEKFDPNFHEAVMRVEDDAQEDGTIAEELQSGYSVRGRVIRPSMVKVVGN